MRLSASLLPPAGAQRVGAGRRADSPRVVSGKAQRSAAAGTERPPEAAAGESRPWAAAGTGRRSEAQPAAGKAAAQRLKQVLARTQRQAQAVGTAPPTAPLESEPRTMRPSEPHRARAASRQSWAAAVPQQPESNPGWAQQPERAEGAETRQRQTTAEAEKLAQPEGAAERPGPAPRRRTRQRTAPPRVLATQPREPAQETPQWARRRVEA